MARPSGLDTVKETVTRPVEAGYRSAESPRESLLRALADLAETFPNFLLLDAAVSEGPERHPLRDVLPDRSYLFDLCEHNAIAVAARLAQVGLVPVVTMQAGAAVRAVEQARRAIAHPGSNAKIVATHAGLDAGSDGLLAPTLEDIAAFRAIPGMTVIAPAYPVEMAQATRAMLEHPGPVYVRAGRTSIDAAPADPEPFEIGRGRILRDGSDVTVVACGVQVPRALAAAEHMQDYELSARVVNMSTIKPIDTELLRHCAEETGCVVTAEDHTVHGGLGSAVAETLMQTCPCPMEFVGVHDTFGGSGCPDELADRHGLTRPYIEAAARRAIRRKEKGDVA